MKKYAVVAVALPLAVVVVMALARYGHAQRETGENIPLIPSSLDNYYPPKGDGPVYLFAMYEMAKPLSGLACDVFENDFDNARSNFESFKKEYTAVSNMVPEWKHLFPTEPINELGNAMEIGDPGKIMAAYETVGGICDVCHRQYMPAVYQRYHWGDFGAITVADPLTHEDVSFGRLMLLLETSFTGAGVDLEQGQLENARKQFQGFSSRFRAMVETCSGCHESERKYYADGQILGMIDSLGVRLNDATVDPAAIGALFQSIGIESCRKCHLVHLPAAYSAKK
jgi:cytochrome c556